MTIERHHISAQELLHDSFRLGMQILDSGFRPDFIIGIWRGGAPVGIAVQELLEVADCPTDHIAIRTSAYSSPGQRSETVQVHGLGYMIRKLNSDDSLLIVDDVFDTGLSIDAVIQVLHERTRRNMPADVRVATPWFKPDNNKTSREPDYYLHKTDKWLVFPHELQGMSTNEICSDKPDLKFLADWLTNRSDVSLKTS